MHSFCFFYVRRVCVHVSTHEKTDTYNIHTHTHTSTSAGKFAAAYAIHRTSTKPTPCTRQHKHFSVLHTRAHVRVTYICARSHIHTCVCVRVCCVFLTESRVQNAAEMRTEDLIEIVYARSAVAVRKSHLPSHLLCTPVHVQYGMVGCWLAVELIYIFRAFLCAG